MALPGLILTTDCAFVRKFPKYMYMDHNRYYCNSASAGEQFEVTVDRDRFHCRLICKMITIDLVVISI